jgi:hypothetical protein
MTRRTEEARAFLIKLLDIVETPPARVRPSQFDSPGPSISIRRGMEVEEFILLLLFGAGVGFMLFVLGNGSPF